MGKVNSGSLDVTRVPGNGLKAEMSVATTFALTLPLLCPYLKPKRIMILEEKMAP